MNDGLFHREVSSSKQQRDVVLFLVLFLKERDEVAGGVWSSLAIPPDSPATSIDPRGAHPLDTSRLGGSREVSVHQLPSHFPSLSIHGCAPVGHAESRARSHEAILLRGTRLCLWSGHADPAHHDRADASGPGRVPRRLPTRGGEVGGRQQLSQGRAPQSVHGPARPAPALSRRTPSRGNPRLLASRAPEAAAR